MPPTNQPTLGHEATISTDAKQWSDKQHGRAVADRHHHSKSVGRSRMPSTVVDQIDAPEAPIASFPARASEGTLVAAAKNGNEQAFEILVKRHEQRILAV